ncbi:hypothetical protein [Herminiimonas fonticola]|uniref:Uncharacterized protein n=1 Tax=Herminiimonas fonticola TaxID=303380 RepID=A0A4R6GIF7_9BURK|nr:hypothetical protein [Herminiimonas fonticola]RBA25075.1 hypothetical protein Hfont_0708 [Herminiimonas fonticola]TDN94190.1 hypothetical protein EV677_0732 [Herminiimonas fonticola]
MNANDVVELLSDSLRTAKEAGASSVPIERLEAFSLEIKRLVQNSPSEQALPEVQMERYKAELTAWIGDKQHLHAWNLEMLRSVIVAGQAALKSSLLINGAAAVALLAFIGNMVSSNKSSVVIGTAEALVFYVFGVLVAAVATGLTYFSQAGYGNEFGKYSRTMGLAGHIGAVIFVLVSYVMFGYASFLAYRMFICIAN